MVGSLFFYTFLRIRKEDSNSESLKKSGVLKTVKLYYLDNLSIYGIMVYIKVCGEYYA